MKIAGWRWQIGSFAAAVALASTAVAVIAQQKPADPNDPRI